MTDSAPSWLERCSAWWSRALRRAEQALQQPRWRWLGNTLSNPRLWCRRHRRGMARAVAIGVFCGILVPVAQAPLAAGLAVAARANLPAAVVGTLVSNPVTFVPLYVSAWRVGEGVRTLLGWAGASADQDDAQRAAPTPSKEWLRDKNAEAMATWLRDVAPSLAIGLALFATVGAALAYGAVNGGWRLAVRRRRQRRLHQRHMRQFGPSMPRAAQQRMRPPLDVS